MPLFSYRCPLDSEDVDLILSFQSSQEPQFCPICGEQMDPVIAAPASFKTGKYGKGNR